jgi:hypothetical protein
MTAAGQPAPVPAENLIRAACGMLVLMKHAAGGRDRKQFTRLPAHCAHHVAVADATRGVDPAHAVRHLRWGRRVVGRARQRQRDRHRPTASAATASQPAGGISGTVSRSATAVASMEARRWPGCRARVQAGHSRVQVALF